MLKWKTSLALLLPTCCESRPALFQSVTNDAVVNHRSIVLRLHGYLLLQLHGNLQSVNQSINQSISQSSTFMLSNTKNKYSITLIIINIQFKDRETPKKTARQSLIMSNPKINYDKKHVTSTSLSKRIIINNSRHHVMIYLYCSNSYIYIIIYIVIIHLPVSLCVLCFRKACALNMCVRQLCLCACLSV